MASSFSSWSLSIEGKSNFNSSATVSAICADQSCQIEHMRGSNIGHELDQGPTRRVETSEPSVGHYYRPSLAQLSKNYDQRRSARSQDMRVIGLRETIYPSRESIGNCKGFSPHMAVLRRFFFAEYALPVLYDCPGHPRWQF